MYMILEKDNIDMSNLRWITVKKKDSDKGRHVLVTKRDGIVVAGLGDRFIGKKIDDIYGDDFDKIAVKGNTIHDMFNEVTLTEKEEESIRDYTGPRYMQINRLLRNPDIYKDKKTIDGLDKQYIENTAKEIHEALSKSKLKKPIVVYRCIHKGAIKNMEIGMTLKDNGFMSTSSSEDIFNEHFGRMAWKIKLRVPKGIHALSVMDYSNFSEEEQEVLLDSGLEYKVVKVDGDNIICEVQPTE